MPLEIDHIRKTYGKFPALGGVSLRAEDSEFIALLGPSGSGKTTLLRCIAGLEVPDSGSIRFRGESLLAQKVRDRRIGLVFQHYALFRHMTAAQNVAFGLRAKRGKERPNNRQINARVEELIALVQLDGLAGRYPSQLSGGQRQRVALARALAIEPRILLLDEPFGALDAKVRRELRRWLRQLHERTGLTTIFVTHDQEEALELADRVALLKDGALEQVGTPEELYHQPATPFVFEFLGDVVKLPCEIVDGAAVFAGARAKLLGGSLTRAGSGLAYVRPDAFDIVVGESEGLKAVLRDVVSAGASARLDCLFDGGEPIEIRAPHDVALQLKIGDRVTLRPREARVW
ncbi:MAG: sulfate transport system ATP-binding protein [Alphaproteobacteria bacterium]|nr:MAG: sulfate transport system ATP-binding protein [Caulobacteraceae bacterium]TPW08387.1 MAG: sulfate transport system ATP-binding protein [Alphaproteobacteria bacterium]